MTSADLLIIGGGQAGLATADHALSLGRRPLVLDASPGPGGSWPRYYESLKLFSPARFSALPGVPFPGEPEHYPTRDETVAYLLMYAARLDTDIRYNQHVQRVVKDGGTFTVTTSAGLSLQARQVVVATGGFGNPRIPRLPGIAGFGGRILHSCNYQRPGSFAGDRVIVVGGGNSAVQIAVELASTANVSLTTRHKLRWQQQRILGRDFHWWLDRTGIDRSRAGRLLVKHGTPIVDDGQYRSAINARRPDRREMFRRITNKGVIWADGTHEDVDTIILATGFLPDTPFLPTAALDAKGIPLQSQGVSTTIPGLGYVGFEHQRTLASATLRGVGHDAQRVLRTLGTSNDHLVTF